MTKKVEKELMEETEEKIFVISQKNAKILWARAAGRCSLEECRLELTLEKIEEGMLTYGEMCHIVGEKTKATRGISPMTAKDRAEYHNLILLCANHHTQIDGDEKKYPIEILHRIKTKHEQWVQESLSAKKLTATDILYTSLIDFLSTNLKLDEWELFIANASRNILHGYYIDTFDRMQHKSLEIDLPGKNLEIENAITNLINSYIAFVECFLEFSAIREGGSDFFAADTSYKKIFPNLNYDYYVARHNLWGRRGFAFLCMYTVRVNEFVKAVRKNMNPYFYITKGNFLVSDDLGVHNGGDPSLVRPTFELAKKRLDILNQEYQEFDTLYVLKF